MNKNSPPESEGRQSAEPTDFLKAFRSGAPIELLYHGDVRKVTSITHQREGAISVVAGSMLPVILRTDGTYGGNTPISLRLATPALPAEQGGKWIFTCAGYMEPHGTEIFDKHLGWRTPIFVKHWEAAMDAPKEPKETPE